MFELAHIGYVVADIRSALRRFQREGARIIIEPTVDPRQKVEVCLLDPGGGVDIELVAPVGRADSPVTARLGKGGGLDHLCYLVGDVAGALAAETEKGAVVVCEPTYAVAFGREVGFVHRRSGLVIELMSSHEVTPP